MNSLESNCLKDCFQDSACQEVILQATVQTCDEKAFPEPQCNVCLGNRGHTVKRNSRISINTLAGGTSPDFANLQANGGLNRNHNQSSLTMTCRNIGDVRNCRVVGVIQAVVQVYQFTGKSREREETMTTVSFSISPSAIIVFEGVSDKYAPCAIHQVRDAEMAQ